MKPLFRKLPGESLKRILIVLFACFFACLLSSCMMADAGVTETEDTFPRPLGELMIPLDMYPTYYFSHAEFDTAGAMILRVKDMAVYFHDLGDPWHQNPDPYIAYSVEDKSSGLLLQYIDLDRDTAGIYVVGRYLDTVITPAADTLLWLPQALWNGTWTKTDSSVMRRVSADTLYWTPGYDSEGVQGRSWEGTFSGHHAILFEETAGSIKTYWYVRQGLGILGYERFDGGRLIATATLTSWNVDGYYY